MSDLASREHLTWLCDELQRRLDIAEAENHELRGVIQWMSGSADFALGGQAHEGWLKVRHLAAPRAARQP